MMRIIIGARELRKVEELPLLDLGPAGRTDATLRVASLSKDLRARTRPHLEPAGTRGECAWDPAGRYQGGQPHTLCGAVARWL
eukprot:COSAG06_NODE_61181_length_268_cov_0.917160_1_plen_82_part_01